MPIVTPHSLVHIGVPNVTPHSRANYKHELHDCAVLHLAHLDVPVVAGMCGIIIGTPRCGCTSMYFYMQDVYMCQLLQGYVVLHSTHLHVPVVGELGGVTISIHKCASSCRALWCYIQHTRMFL